MKTELSPVNILAKCFKRDGETLVDFKAEIDSLRKLPDYDAFVQECADFLGVCVKAA